MKLLLDTHTFLWFINGSPKLSDHARTLIADLENTRFLSVASLWEMSIKVSLGKLKVVLSFPELIQREVYGNAIELLQIEPEHLDVLATLPFYHKDPFDRLIVAQSMVEDIPIISTDAALSMYSVQLVW